MTKRTLWIVALGAIVGLSTVPASACYVVGHKNGEDICSTTSDGATVENKTVTKKGGKWVIKKSSKNSYTNSPTWVSTKGSIQITTSKGARIAATSSRVLVRHTNSNAIRQAHRWH